MEPEHKPLQIPLFDPAQQLAVGIQEYIAPGHQIPAITKYLLSDFIVNQIDTNSNLVVIQHNPNDPNSLKYQKKPPNYSMTPALLEEIVANLGKQAAHQIETLYEKLQSGQKLYTWEHTIDQVPKEKSQRLKIHTFVREKLENIESNTMDNNKIRLKFNYKLKKMNPLSRHKYIHFKLFKSNIDTMSAIFKLHKITGISHKIFSTAGLKDKRGITTQMVSVWNSDINSLKRFYDQADRNREIWIEGFQEQKDDAIGVGCLFGNQFGLILRLLKPQDSALIEERVQEIKEYGIINYFGMQRFGSCATKTHLIGVRMVKKQWKQVVEELLLEDTGMSSLNNLKREMYESKQYGKGERALGSKYKIEKSLFQGLERHGQNFANVFENLPRSMKTLYCHALQSYLWNKMTSRRLREHGKQLVVGDLVGVRVKGKETSKQQNEGKVEMKEKEEEGGEEAVDDGEEAVDEEELQVVVITEENMKDYEFTDLTAPLYGVSIELPENCIMSKYLDDQLKGLELVKSDFHDKAKSLCFKGAYRKCIIKPPQIEYEILEHKEKKAELLSAFYMRGEKVKFEEGELRSVRIVLQLPKSSYATIAIREILHIPSSYKVQTELNRLYDNL